MCNIRNFRKQWKGSKFDVTLDDPSHCEVDVSIHEHRWHASSMAYYHHKFADFFSVFGLCTILIFQIVFGQMRKDELSIPMSCFSHLWSLQGNTIPVNRRMFLPDAGFSNSRKYTWWYSAETWHYFCSLFLFFPASPWWLPPWTWSFSQWVIYFDLVPVPPFYVKLCKMSWKQTEINAPPPPPYKLQCVCVPIGGASDARVAHRPRQSPFPIIEVEQAVATVLREAETRGTECISFKGIATLWRSLWFGNLSNADPEITCLVQVFKRVR